VLASAISRPLRQTAEMNESYPPGLRFLRACLETELLDSGQLGFAVRG
jgi:hypothetical protein